MRSANGRELTVLLSVQVAATVLAWAIPEARALRAQQREKTSQQREIEARTEARVDLNDTLDPIVRLLGQIACEPSKPKRDQLRAQAVPVVLSSASQAIGPKPVRAVWFRLEEGPPQRLVFGDRRGRAELSRSVFKAGTAAGDSTIEMVLSNSDLLCEDLEQNPPLGWDAGKDREYRTFISVSVATSTEAFGMLTLDALEPGDLDQDDVRMLRLLGGLLAAALAHRTPDPGDEIVSRTT